MKFSHYVKLFMLVAAGYGVYAIKLAIESWEASSLFSLGIAIGFVLGIVVCVVIMALFNQSIITLISHLKGALTPAIREDAKVNAAYQKAAIRQMDFSQPAPQPAPTKADQFFAQHAQYRG
jgi:hypothetical protein